MTDGLPAKSASSPEKQELIPPMTRRKRGRSGRSPLNKKRPDEERQSRPREKGISFALSLEKQSVLSAHEDAEHGSLDTSLCRTETSSPPYTRQATKRKTKKKKRSLNKLLHEPPRHSDINLGREDEKHLDDRERLMETLLKDRRVTLSRNQET